MMINLKISDELAELYIKKFGVPGCYQAMKQAIDLCKDVNKDDRVVLLSGDSRRALEKVFQTTVDDAAKLVKLTQNMSTVRLGDVEMEFSSDQLERLRAQAGFHGRSLETFIREQVAEIKEAMLEKV